MTRSLRKAAAFIGALSITAMLVVPGAAAESKQRFKADVVLKSEYDAVLECPDSALFFKNGNADSITDKTEIVRVKPDGTVQNVPNTNKIEKIYNCDLFTKGYYSCTGSYLTVGIKGKQALMKRDGSMVNNALYDEILSYTKNFVVVKEGDKCVVRKMDSAVVKEYDDVDRIYMVEGSGYLFIVLLNDDQQHVDVFDKDLKELKFPEYDYVVPVIALGDVLNNNQYLAVKDGKYGLINKAGTVIIPVEYEYFEQVDDHLFMVEKDGKSGVLDNTGKEIIPIQYDDINTIIFQNNLYFAAQNAIKSEDLYEVTDRTIYAADGRVYLDKAENLTDWYLAELTNGYIQYQDTDTNLYGIYDFSKKASKIDAEFDRILDMNADCFAYEKDGQLGVMTYDKKDLIKIDKMDDSYIRFDDAYFFVSGIDYENYGARTTSVYELKTGKFLFKTDQFNSLLYNHGYFEGYNWNSRNQEKEKALFDKTGKQVMSTEQYTDFDWCTSNSKDLLFQDILIANKDKKIMLIDINGNLVLDKTYQSMGAYSSDNFYGGRIFLFNDQTDSHYVIVGENNKYGLLNLLPIVKATGLNLDRNQATLKIGETLTLTPRFAPADTTNQTVTWSSSDESVASVKDGVITAVKEGSVAITAISVDGNFKAVCTVTVTKAETPNNTDEQDPSKKDESTSNTDKTPDEQDPSKEGGSPSNVAKTKDENQSPKTGSSPLAAGTVAVVVTVAAFAVKLTIRKSKKV